jgi:hypothetical protein
VVLVLMLACSAAPGIVDIWAGVYPMTMISELGAGRAAGPSRADLRARVAIGELGCWSRAQEFGQRGRGVELSRAGQVRNAGRDGRVRAGGGDIDHVDGLGLELIGA